MDLAMKLTTAPILPGRVRRIHGSFTFIPSRFLHSGFLASLDRAEIALYFFLLLASNRVGVSCYHYDRICEAIGIDGDTYIRARDGLIAKDLLAFDGPGGRFQVLALPERPARSQTTRRPSSQASPQRARCVQQTTNGDERSLQSIREIIAALDD
jgi:hypothetical protein